MAIRCFAVVLVAILTLPLLAAAQEKSPPSDLQIELKRKRAIVLPRPPQAVIERDLEEARDQITQPDRTDQLVRESREVPRSRPELDYSIANAIQARNALRALGR